MILEPNKETKKQTLKQSQRLNSKDNNCIIKEESMSLLPAFFHVDDPCILIVRAALQ